jgi:hypothetical protein
MQLLLARVIGKCPRQFRNGVFLTGALILEEVAPISFDSECPEIEPDIGWNKVSISSEEWIISEIKGS